MKKNFKYALLGAIALTGAVSFSACSSSDEIVDNPNYDPETNTVKAQLAISLQDNIAKTRMSGDATQSTGTVGQFLGMKNIKLVPYQSDAVISSSPILTKTILDLNDIPSSSSGTAKESNTVYTDVAVPVNTNRFLLYGSAGQTAGFDNGILSVAGLGSNTAENVSSVSFTPVPICSDVTAQDEYRKFKNILQLLNRVAHSSVTSGTTTETWAPGDNQTTVASLASLYTTFTSVTVGSSEYVKYLLEYLYKGVNASATNESSPGHALAQKIQENIKAALTYTDGEATINCAENTFDTSNNLTLASDYDGYPTALNLPHGAIRIGFSGGSFVDGSNSNIGTFSVTSLSSYTYPANLQYFVESDILTSNDKVLNGTISSFATAKSLYGASPSKSVSSLTRSILLNQQIQYGVGRFEASVNKLSGTKYFDRAGNVITIPVGGYTLKGILIGDQKAVGWNFVRLESSPTYTIYDKRIAGETAGSAVTSSASSAKNHTLVLETVDDSPINVALEFVNNGDAFEGADGTVPAGATFYLIGTLTPSSSDPNYGEGATKTKKVFAQDFVTTADFTIGTGAKSDDPNVFDKPDGFGEALVGLPDLRQPQIELGLSVDLTWTPGLSFSVDL